MSDRKKVETFTKMLQAQVDYFNTTIDDRIQIKIDVSPKHEPIPYCEPIKLFEQDYDEYGNFIS